MTLTGYKRFWLSYILESFDKMSLFIEQYHMSFCNSYIYIANMELIKADFIICYKLWKEIYIIISYLFILNLKITS